VVCLLGLLWLTSAPAALLNALVDLRTAWYPRQATGEIVIVAVDSPSIEKVGLWPWPRSLHAELIEKLRAAGAQDIAFDVDFSSPSPSDDAFEAALRKADGSVILPAFKQRTAEGTRVNLPIRRLSDNAWTALVNVVADQDGVVRRYPFGDRVNGSLLPSMGATLSGGVNSPTGSFGVDFSIRPESVPTISYIDIIRGEPAALRAVENKKVLVGGTALELGDRFTVPGGKIISGPLLQVLAADSILQSRALQQTGVMPAILSVGLLMLLMFFCWKRLASRQRVILLVVGAIAGEIGAAFFQSKVPLIIDTSLFVFASGAYLIAIALDEIDFRGWLGKIANDRFQRITMALGDGLICADSSGNITVWNSAAATIFGYEAKEAIGRPLTDFIGDPQKDGAFSLLDFPQTDLQAPGGVVVELEGAGKRGNKFPAEACFSAWLGEDGLQYGIIVRDISVRKQKAEIIRRLAEYDTLTGLANRHTFNQRLAKEIETSREVALLLFDLDTFKEINDTMGHVFGDEVLSVVAGRLKDAVGDEGLVARLGGDEFAIVLGGDAVGTTADALCRKIMAIFNTTPQRVGSHELRLKACMGVAIYPNDGNASEDLLANADLALYRAKSEGRARHLFFSTQLRTELEQRRELEAELETALDNGEFELFYQPQVDLKNGRVVGAEALIRWRHPKRGMVSPGLFMPVINRSPQSSAVGRWVLATACAQGAAWQAKGHDLRIGVNLSPSQLQSGDLPAVVSAVLAESRYSPKLLELEVTEDIVLADENQALKMFKELRQLGVKMAFDDFGTGFASLSYLKKFRLDVLKVDQTFVKDLQASPQDLAIVAATIGLSRQLGLFVIAEGIEDQATADLLLSLGCDEGQGYLYAKPLPASEFEERFLSVRKDVAAA
jgi:diguanylate cyclase (GGDEF)-like protein/PAS domain S-box-containing protein